MGKELILDTERLHMLFGDSDEFLTEIYEIVTTDFPENRDMLARALDDGDIESISRYAHTLKGSIANIGGIQASSGADAINKAAGLGDLEACRALFPQFDAQFNDFVTALGDYVKRKHP
jgi:HPt (histidine-containing phosphotransfer) domain-containing protein